MEEIDKVVEILQEVVEETKSAEFYFGWLGEYAEKINDIYQCGSNDVYHLKFDGTHYKIFKGDELLFDTEKFVKDNFLQLTK